MVRVVKVYLNVSPVKFWLLVLLIIALSTLFFNIYLFQLVYVSLLILLIFGFAEGVLLYNLFVMKKTYKKYLELLNNISYREGKICLETNNISMIHLRIKRYFFRGILRIDLDLEELEKVNDIDLSIRQPYVFIGEINNQSGFLYSSNEVTRIYYEGTAYMFTYRDEKYLLIPIYPTTPIVTKNIVKSKWGRDYAELRINSVGDRLDMEILYVRQSSRNLEIVLETPSFNPFNSVDSTVLTRIDKPGEHRYSLDLPSIRDTHILILPLKKIFIANTRIPLSEFIYEGKLLNNKLILGYNNIVVKLVVHRGFGEKMYSTTNIVAKPF